jgi:hypothetical protein
LRLLVVIKADLGVVETSDVNVKIVAAVVETATVVIKTDLSVVETTVVNVKTAASVLRLLLSLLRPI